MPITFLPNPNGPRLGPGIQLSFSSDFVGPLPSGSFWRVSLTGAGGDNSPWIVWEKPTQSPFGGRWTPFLPDLGAQLTTRVDLTLQAGQTAHAQAELVTPTGVIDSGTITANWDATSGMPTVIDQRVGTQGGGFTVSDRQQLALAVSNTMVDLTTPAQPVDPSKFPLSRVPFIAPILGAQRVGPFSLTGRGSLSLASISSTSIWMGMRWFFETLPPGFGFTPGAIDEFERRIVQLAVVYSIGTGEQIANPVIDADQSGGFLDFPVQPGLTAIEYQVAPGCTVSLFLYRVLGT